LRFVWGRSRLPAASDFKEKFSLTLLVDNQTQKDFYLPSSHTCFFALDMPAYSSEEIMREKLLKAITMCASIENC